jgi:putative transposase
VQREPGSTADESRWHQGTPQEAPYTWTAFGSGARYRTESAGPAVCSDRTESEQKWAADFTYVWTGEGWLFVGVVLDLYLRRIVGWSIQPTMTAQLVMDALLMAIFCRGRPRAVLHHSDQGSLYTSEDFQRLLASHGIMCSMSRCGNCWDNAAMESFFSTMKTERLRKKHYRTRDD